MARSLSQQLQTTCLVLVSSLPGLPGLPGQLQQEAPQGPRGVRLERIRESLDHVMDYMVNNTPLNWLVGPFYPRMVVMETPTAGPSSQPCCPEPESPPPQEDS